MFTNHRQNVVDEQEVVEGIRQHGAAPGSKAMLKAEMAAADLAIETGIYGVWRSNTGEDLCGRVGPTSRCFCGHEYSTHKLDSKGISAPCVKCECRAFKFIPKRPEEVGESWLLRRKGFDVRKWRAKCRCKHTHEEHGPNPDHHCKICGCKAYVSAWLCLACEKKWSEHETLFETKDERLAANRPVGNDFRPLASNQELQALVFQNMQTAPTPDCKSPEAKRLPRGDPWTVMVPQGVAFRSEPCLESKRDEVAKHGLVVRGEEELVNDMRWLKLDDGRWLPIEVNGTQMLHVGEVMREVFGGLGARMGMGRGLFNGRLAKGRGR